MQIAQHSKLASGSFCILDTEHFCNKTLVYSTFPGSPSWLDYFMILGYYDLTC